MVSVGSAIARRSMRLKPELFIPELQSFEMDGADYIPWKSELQSLSGAATARIRIS